MPAIGPYSKARVLRSIDGRSREGRALRRIRNQLVAHLGGADRITRVQSLLIDRAAVPALRMEMMDADPCALMDERQGRQYVAYSNGYVRLLRELGIEAPRPAPGTTPTLADHLARRAREAVAA